MSVQSLSFVAARGAPPRVTAAMQREVEPSSEPAHDALVALQRLPETATLRDVVEALLGERPRGHSQTYANVILTQRALARLAAAAAGRSVAGWEPEA